MPADDRRSWRILRGHFSARATQKLKTAYGSCRSRGRQERAHRSLENRTERGFPQLPQALSSGTEVLPMFPVNFVTYLPGCSQGFHFTSGFFFMPRSSADSRSIAASSSPKYKCSALPATARSGPALSAAVAHVGSFAESTSTTSSIVVITKCRVLGATPYRYPVAHDANRGVSSTVKVWPHRCPVSSRCCQRASRYACRCSCTQDSPETERATAADQATRKLPATTQVLDLHQ